MGCHPSHWRTHIFQDGYCTTNQMGLDPEPYPSDSSRKVPQSHQLPKPTLCRCHRGRCWGRGPGVWIGICYFGRSLKINGNFSQWPFQEPKLEVPSGKLTVCELERSTMLLMGKSTISMVIFNSYVKLPEGRSLEINGNFRILKWRYVSTIFLAIFCGEIPWRPYIGLIYGRYL